jgi:hypothetical protein
MTRTELLDEYEGLTLKCAKLREQLRDAEQRRDEVRALLTANEEPPGEAQKSAASGAVKPPTKSAKRKSVYEHMRRKPPAQAVKEVYDLAKERGKIHVQDVVARFNLAPGAAALRLSRAVKAGWLVRSAHGLYEPDPMPP